ncbi:MAG: hypothetical protein E6845_09290 [Clostridium sp.]|uniref:hypothetical protein n=1 Tax=Clostridium sp. TaxID=1506 RepID=UPI002901BEAC|nr:hypothetical protein [Clostridium sp.]MDU1603146.1 hypothetical protein [Clostridium sp.]
MKVENEEKLKKIQEIKENFNDLKIESLDLEDFWEGLIKKELLIITPPITSEIEDENLQYVSLENSILKGGSSRKPGNIILNMEDCLGIIISSSISITSALTNQNIAMKLMGLLGVVCSLNQKMKINISPDQASVLRIIYTKCNEKKEIEIETCYKELNKIREENDNHILSKIQYSHILDDLCKLNCISLENNVIYLKEKIKIKY